MELYLLKSAVILTILFAFYKIVLEDESMHVFKRFYLLGSLPVAFLIPLVTFTNYVEVPFSSSPVFIDNSFPMAAPEASVNIWPFIFWGLYALGVVFFSIKFGKNLNQLISKIKNNPKFTRNSIHHILLKAPVIPHTFLNYVFLNKQKFETQEIPEEVIQHEHIHAKQKHSLDILLVELLQIVFWFNPLLYFMKSSIKLNHEFLADRAVINLGTDPVAYQNILLAFSSNAITPTLANSINYSFIKKRFTVMKKQTSTQSIWLRSLLLVPLVALILYGFSTKEIIQKQTLAAENRTELSQEKVTPKMIEEYNAIAKKWNDPNVSSFEYIKGEKERALYIYNLMSDSQKRESEHFPIRITNLLQNPHASSSINSPTFPKNVTALIEDIHNKKGIIYYGKERITYKQALEVSKSKDYKGGIRTNYAKKIPELHLLRTEDSQISPPPAPPAPATPKVAKNPPLPLLPAPPPPAPLSDPIEYIKALHKSGAVFFIGPHQYNYEKVLDMAKKTNDLNIDISQYPKVNLLGC